MCIDAKGIEQHFVDGSYVTNKEKPGDIDLLLTFNDDVYDSEESYNKYFEITQNQKKMKEDYEVHVFFAKDTTDVDPLEIQRFWDIVKKKVLDWWARFYIDGENNIVDGKNKGFIVFYKKISFENKMTNQKSIKQELMEVQQLILENQYLQDKYPEKKLQLELGLNSLKELESEIFEALKKKN